MLVNGKPGNLTGIRYPGMLYGDGVFRTFHAFDGKAQHWPLHEHKIQHDGTAPGIACRDSWTGFPVATRIGQSLNQQDAR